MYKLYTAIGQLRLSTNNYGIKEPVIMYNERVFELNKSEMIIWSSLMWHISDYDEIFDIFKRKISETSTDICDYIIKLDFDTTLNRLITRKIVVVSENDNGMVCVYNLLKDLTIKSSTANFKTILIAFLKFTFIDKMPLIKASKLFYVEKFNDDEKSLLALINKYSLKTSEIISILINSVNHENLSYSNSYDTPEIKDEDLHILKFTEITYVLETICFLYVKKAIQFT